MVYFLNLTIFSSITSSSCSFKCYFEVFFLALSKEDLIGSFKIGKSFDALLVDMNLGSPAGVFPSHDIVDLIQKFIYCGDDRNIKKVFVNGKVVSGR